ncbi:MAG: hypothetical protein EOP06_05995 [Proteobacteria bacterium]|nr:MAG: hypothetical protein EOP06_05995 [Pseudomonadota bacterium]
MKNLILAITSFLAAFMLFFQVANAQEEGFAERTAANPAASSEDPNLVRSLNKGIATEGGDANNVPEYCDAVCRRHNRDLELRGVRSTVASKANTGKPTDATGSSSQAGDK